MTSLYSPLYRLIILTASMISIVGCSSFSSVDYKKYQQPRQDILITNVNTLSTNGETMLFDHNILIRDGEIIAVTVNDIDVESALVIDGQDKYIIPGLVDSHVHLQKSENDLLVYLAHGITYIREMSGNDEHLNWKEDIENGRAGPSIEVSSEKISSKAGLWGMINELFWNRINISSEQDAIELAEALSDEGYANAKISSDISKDMYFAISKAAISKELNVAGHIPLSVSFDEFIESGQSEIAHIEELVKLINKEFGYFTTNNSSNFIDFVRVRSQEIAKELKKHNISVGTTFWYMQSIPKQIANLPDLIAETDLSFTNPKRVTEWLPENNNFALNHNQYNDWWAIFAKANEVVLRELIENDVTVLVGTDAMTSLVVPGISLHQELEALVKAGMSNSEAIKGATVVPAQWMKNKVGKIDNGYKADLLILNSDPLQNIKATTHIDAVIKDGRFYSKQLLETMLNNIRNEYGN